MHQGSQTRVAEPDPASEPRLLLRERRFVLATNAVGCESDLARARFLDINSKTIRNARKGHTVGGDFAARTIAKLRQPEYADQLAEVGITPTLDSLFEVAA